MLRLLAMVLCLTSFSALADTPDQCRDILTGGAFTKSNYKSNDFLMQILHSRLFTQTYDEAKKDESFGATIPIDDVMVGLDWDKSTYEEHRAAIKKSLDYKNVEKHALEIAVSSGDPVIAKAWTDCMSSKGGFYIWLEPVNAKTARLRTLWNAGGFKPTNAQIKSVGSEPQRKWTRATSTCLFPGRTYRPGEPCNELITLTSSTQDLAITANADGSAPGAAYAYLPPRLMWTSRIVKLSSTVPGDADRPYSEAAARAEEGEQLGNTVCFKKERLAKGFPLASSFNSPVTYGSCYGDGHCQSLPAITTTDACWTAKVFPDQRHASCGCLFPAEIKILQAGWVPVDSAQGVGAGVDKQVRLRYQVFQTEDYDKLRALRSQQLRLMGAGLPRL